MSENNTIESIKKINWELVISLIALLISVAANIQNITNWYQEITSNHRRFIGEYTCVKGCTINKTIRITDNGGAIRCKGENGPIDDAKWDGDKLYCAQGTATLMSWGLSWNDGSMWLKN